MLHVPRTTATVHDAPSRTHACHVPRNGWHSRAPDPRHRTAIRHQSQRCIRLVSAIEIDCPQAMPGLQLDLWVVDLLQVADDGLRPLAIDDRASEPPAPIDRKPLGALRRSAAAVRSLRRRHRACGRARNSALRRPSVSARAPPSPRAVARPVCHGSETCSQSPMACSSSCLASVMAERDELSMPALTNSPIASSSRPPRSAWSASAAVVSHPARLRLPLTAA